MQKFIAFLKTVPIVLSALGRILDWRMAREARREKIKKNEVARERVRQEFLKEQARVKDQQMHEAVTMFNRGEITIEDVRQARGDKHS